MAGKRAKGFRDWNPYGKTKKVATAVLAVIEEYKDDLPLTLRQVFYRLVVEHEYEKTEQAYKRLGNLVVAMRRAQMIPFHIIKDDGVKQGSFEGGYESPDEFMKQLEEMGHNYFRNNMEGQPKRIEVWCEAGGMVDGIAKLTRTYGIACYSTGGFSSVTVTKRIADRALRHDRPTIIMHIGDHDPSGVSLYETIIEDASTFVAQLRTGLDVPRCVIEPVRVAVTAAQIAEYSLPTAPPKTGWTGRKGDKGDSRSIHWEGDTCQAEAFKPAELRDLLREELEARLDMDLFKDSQARETEERTAILTSMKETFMPMGIDRLHRRAPHPAKSGSSATQPIYSPLPWERS